MASSVWGKGDEKTIALFKKHDLRGRWLNLAAGDGRYNLFLLQKADSVTVADIDKRALNKLLRAAPEKYRSKLQLSAFDLTKRFPFDKHSFEGVFCTGALHLFQPEVLRKIVAEIHRVLKSGGSVIIDFATDVRRVLPDGSLYFHDNEPRYDLHTADTLLRKLFKDYDLKIIRSRVSNENVNTGDLEYVFNCNFLLLNGKKKA
ncbi:MAG: class I SAM-dependent methyltransferase [Candidatus Micrarchaeota archaeon]